MDIFEQRHTGALKEKILDSSQELEKAYEPSMKLGQIQQNPLVSNKILHSNITLGPFNCYDKSHQSPIFRSMRRSLTAEEFLFRLSTPKPIISDNHLSVKKKKEQNKSESREQ